MVREFVNLMIKQGFMNMKVNLDIKKFFYKILLIFKKPCDKIFLFKN